jgi:hypothetical protein
MEETKFQGWQNNTLLGHFHFLESEKEKYWEIQVYSTPDHI